MKKLRFRDGIFILLVVLIHAVFFGLALHYGKFYNGDSYEYIQQAFNIKEHGFFYSGNMALPISPELKTLRTPGYPLFLLGIYSLVVSNKLVLLVQNLISILNMLYARSFLTQMGYDKKYDWLLLVFITAFPSQFVYANTVAPDILLQSGALLYFVAAILLWRTSAFRYLLRMSVVLTFALFIKPVLYPFAAIHLFVVLGFVFRKKQDRLRMILTAFIPIAAIALYSFWNFQRTGKFHFTSIQSFNAIYYYHNFVSATQGISKGRAFLDSTRRSVAEVPDFSDRYNKAHQIGVASLAQSPGAYLWFHLRKSLVFFFETGKGELDIFTGNVTFGQVYADQTVRFGQVVKQKSLPGIVEYLLSQPIAVIAILVLIFNVFKMVGVVSFLLFARIHALEKWLFVLFILYFALITGPISNAHYVLPVSLLWSGFAVLGYVAALRRRRENKLYIAC